VSDSDDGRLSVFRQAAHGLPVGELISQARQMYADGRDTSSVLAMVNTFALVEYAAELRDPADVARLVTELGADHATGDLARLALDTAAARRSVADLDALVGNLADRDWGGQASTLLTAVILRRMPRDIAELHSELLESGRNMLISALAEHRTPSQCRVSVLFWLRARAQHKLATQTARRMAERLDPGGLTDLVRGLFAQEDTEIADAAIESALGDDARGLAELILALRDSEQHAVHVIDAAFARLGRDDLLMLASLLDDGGWPDGAREMWGRLVPGTPEQALVAMLAQWVQRTGNRAAAAGPLRLAAQTHPIEPDPLRGIAGVAELAIQAQKPIRDGEFIVLRAVAETRSVSEVFDVIGQLDHRGRPDLAGLLLGAVTDRVHTQKDHDEAATVIDLLLERGGEPSRGTRRGKRKRGAVIPGAVSKICENVAREKDPERLMGLISGLEHRGTPGRSRYADLHEDIEAIVAAHYTGAELARLPLVRRLDHLLAVLEIVKKALEAPRQHIPPEQFPDVLLALDSAGTPDDDVRRMLIHIGAKNKDRDRIAAAFAGRGLSPAADLVRGGRAPLYEVRFYPPPTIR
jgi:hypothetical protein